MSRTRHPEERGTPLAYRRWRRRNVPRTLGRDRQRVLGEVAETVFEMEELDTHDPEVWLHGTNLVTYADTRPKWGPRPLRIDYAEFDPCDHYGPEETWYWDEYYDWRTEWYDDYRDDDTYDGYDDVRYLDPREAAWVVAWLCGEVEANECSCYCCDVYDYEDDCTEFEGEEEFFAVEMPEPKLVEPEPMEPVEIRAQEKKRAGDRYYRTHRRAA